MEPEKAILWHHSGEPFSVLTPLFYCESVVIKSCLPQITSPLSPCQPLQYPLFSSLTTLPQYLLAFLHSSLTTIIPPFLSTAQRTTTAWLPAFFHTESIMSPQPLFIFIHQFNPCSHPSNQIFTNCLPHAFVLITGLRSYSVIEKLGLSSMRGFAHVGCLFSEAQIWRRRAIMHPFLPISSQADIIWCIYFFIFHTLRRKQPTPHCCAP